MNSVPRMEHEPAYHVPVMAQEVLAALNPQPGDIVVDATLGAGGHAAQIAARLRPEGRLIGIDQDPEALAEAERNLSEFGSVVTLVHARFDTMARELEEISVHGVNGVLFDLGVSSHQLDAPERGFSFKDPDAPLDMRMNQMVPGTTAADLLNTLPERDLAKLILRNSDERWAARIAQYVVDRRKDKPYRTVGQLVDTVHAAIPAAARPPDKHAATRTFQALRIEVNNELGILETALRAAGNLLLPGGVLAVLSYHSLEDRIAKHIFAEWCGKGESVGPYGHRPEAIMEAVSRKPVGPSEGEVANNPRARSAKLRAVRKLPTAH